MLYRLAHRVRKLVWTVLRPRIHGVRVLAIDAAGRLVLIRHSYGSDTWMPPGGGMRPGEDPVLAGVRELAEETGLVLGEARLITVVDEVLHGARNRVHIVAGHTIGVPRPDGREIVEAGFFSVDALPRNMAGGLATALPDWLALARDHKSDS